MKFVHSTKESLHTKQAVQMSKNDSNFTCAHVMNLHKALLRTVCSLPPMKIFTCRKKAYFIDTIPAEKRI